MNLTQMFLCRCMAGMAVLVALMTSCKHQEEVFLGTTSKAANGDFIAGNICPAVIDAGGNMEMTCTSNPTLFFNASTPIRCYFNCDFNQEVTWTITIAGRNSGAVKTLTGTSAGLPFGNTLSTWKGDANGFRFFQKGEICDVKINFQGSQVERSTVVTIFNGSTGALNYAQVPGTTLLDNIDAGGTSAFTYSYLDLGDDNHNAISLNRGEGDIIPVEGNFMLRLQGQDINSNTYLGGTGPELLTSHASKVRRLIPSGATDATQLYFNMYVYGTGLNNTCLQIRAYELDGQSITASPADPLPPYSAAEQAANDQWAYDVYINWRGWKLVSVPYSAFKPSNNPSNGGNGNRIQEPRKITGYNILLQSMPNAGSSVDAYVDMITLTWGAAFTTEIKD